MRNVRRAVILASLVLAATPLAGHAQVFLASGPHPDFAIGPLFVVAQVRPELTPIPVTISWSLTVPPGQRAADIEQDLFLLWPTELVEATAPGPADPALAREVTERGFVVSLRHRARIAQPMIRAGWLDRGPGPATRRGAEPFVPVSWAAAANVLARELRRVYGEGGGPSVYGGS